MKITVCFFFALESNLLFIWHEGDEGSCGRLVSFLISLTHWRLHLASLVLLFSLTNKLTWKIKEIHILTLFHSPSVGRSWRREWRIFKMFSFSSSNSQRLFLDNRVSCLIRFYGCFSCCFFSRRQNTCQVMYHMLKKSVMKKWIRPERETWKVLKTQLMYE